MAHASAPDGAGGGLTRFSPMRSRGSTAASHGEHNAGDHVVVFGVVESGVRAREGEPLTHSRKNGLRYAVTAGHQSASSGISISAGISRTARRTVPSARVTTL